jgi:hypothetical protein
VTRQQKNILKMLRGIIRAEEATESLEIRETDELVQLTGSFRARL